MSGRIKHSTIVGLALFALFFGSGNLIFPPSIGNVSGESWVIALIGFSLTGIVLPLMAVLAILNVGGQFEHLMRPLGKWFYRIFTFLLMVIMGMFISTPRMAATTHELGIAPIFPNVPLVVSVVIFFAICFYFTMDKAHVIDRLGKVLTPFLVLVLLYIVFKAFTTPFGEPIEARIDHVFSNAFISAYQTGDATSGVLCATIFIMSIIGYGYKGKEVRKIALNGMVLAGFGLLVIYGGLLFLGASGSSTYPINIDNTQLVTELFHRVLGDGASVLMSVAIALGCLTSAIGVITVLAGFLNDITKNRIGYRMWALIVCIIAAVMGTFGVSSIINYSAPIFNIIYPVIIVLVLLGTFKRFVPNDGAYRGAVFVTQAVSIIETLGSLHIKIPFVYSLIKHLPLYANGMSWVIPAILGFVIGGVVFTLNPNAISTERATLADLEAEQA